MKTQVHVNHRDPHRALASRIPKLTRRYRLQAQPLMSFSLPRRVTQVVHLATRGQTSTIAFLIQVILTVITWPRLFIVFA